MASDITTRRAIEVCLSRLQLWDGARDNLAYHLTVEIEKPSSEPPGDMDAMRAYLREIQEWCRCDERMKKSALVARLMTIAHRCEGALKNG